MRPSARLVLAGSAVLAGVAFASPALAADAAYPQQPGAGDSTTSSVEGQPVQVTFGGFAPGSTVSISVSDGRSFTESASGSPQQSVTTTGAGFHAGGSLEETSIALAPSSHRATADTARFRVETVNAASGSVSTAISFSRAGTYLITASGVAPDGSPRSMTRTIVVMATSADGSGTGTGTASTGTTASTTGTGNTPGSLPFTGMEVGSVLALGAATVIGGTTMRVASRRRADKM